jgi:E3 ubiquitin-protein ligase SHPRH
VHSELLIPPQTEHSTILRLSAVEAHFYRRQHATCANDATRALPEAVRAPGGGDDRTLSTAEVKRVLVPLLKLRQACCHPQARAPHTTLLPRCHGLLSPCGRDA